ncbi:MAG: NarK/NasA family nitrate transporter [Gemmatimonadales bacterium]|jgi:NNP family nitrate/nitrite transporter-like MFS transporter|nr:NarK/NasA family nitrate transporter [Gemmatimonadales bacterium]MBT3499829.1 NarK/NasA family nitrate transporter [Gemmatimonadales bacterium]MBT3774456.1 NarK/NasA family nitrate transporter [Gemmatimonadales bacterium]MBT3958091.1 NarK/NasA family nitrate transporter [Gemmatimonadales bacterium]MBT4189139.1 NarK/NasA family nitrate transporter [Gemmatimonadales bacterium]
MTGDQESKAWPHYWDPDDETFWNREGKSIARRNLWISIPNLLLAFAVWIYWGMIAKYIQQLHFATDGALFDFTFMNGGQGYDDPGYRALLFTLPAVAGLSGATLRIPNSFMVAIAGGRNVKFMTSLLLAVPALSAGIALQNPDTSFLVLIILATMSGVGGGAFASSMSNISFFFPKKEQGLALGLNAGLGNLGVSAMQFLIPWVITFGLFGPIGGDAHQYAVDGGTGDMWIQNAGLVWVPLLVLFVILAFLYMNNLPFHKVGSTPKAVGKYLWLTALGYLGAAVGVVLLVLPWGGFPDLIKTFVIVVVCVVVTLAGMRFLTPKETREGLDEQFGIFKMKHNWIMTYLYVMTFGSFIGYSNAFPKLIDDVFGVIRVGEEAGQATGMSSATFIWMGAGVGALIRPVGGWLSDKLGGARVTHWDTILMIASTIGAGYTVSLAMESPDPTQYFMPFLILFIVLFATTGIGNGSTFRMIGVIFKKDNRGPVLGWTSAIAAYGAYLIPKIFAIQIAAGTPQYALYGFAGYYTTCLVLNWWYYARKNAEIVC